MAHEKQSFPSTNNNSQRQLFLFITVTLTVFTLYWVTLAPGVVGGDAAEHQLAAPLLGIPHATGYPLYILLGKLWTLLIPLGSLAWRMNLFSAFNGALAAGLTSLVVYRLTHALLPSFIAGITLACGLTLWQWSTMAGVRSLNVFFFALLTLESIIWQQQRQANQNLVAERTLYWLALTVGLSLAHHRTTIFYLPSLIIWIGWHDRQLLRQPKRLLTLVVLLLVPLLLYLFIYFRGLNQPPYTHQKITDFQSFWFLVGASDSSGLFMSINWTFLPARLAFIGRDILNQLSWTGVVMATSGAMLLLWRQPKHFLFQGLLVLWLLLFTLDFEVVNLNEAPTWYLMPAYFIFTVWLGVGLNGLYQTTAHFFPRNNFLFIFHASFLILILYTLAWPNWQKIYLDSVKPLDDWRQLLRGNQAERFVESSLPYVEPNSLILGDWEQYTPFIYYQLINGWRTDVTPRLPLDRWPEKVKAARQAGKPVYFMRKTSDLIGTPYLSMVGPLIHLQTSPLRKVPSDIVPLQANFENELELMGYHLKILPQLVPGGQQAGPIIQLMLYWRAPHKLAWDYAISLRLIDSDGQEIYKKDATHPVLSSYPTTLWTAGEVVADFYELPHPPHGGLLTIQVIPYRTEGAGQWHNLILTGTNQEGIKLRVIDK